MQHVAELLRSGTFFTSGEWFRIVLDVFLLYAAIRAARGRSTGLGWMLISIPLIFLLRDVAMFGTDSRAAIQIASLLVLGVYGAIPTTYQRPLAASLAMFIYVAVGIALSVLFSTGTAGRLAEILVEAYILGGVGVLRITLSGVTERSSAIAHEIRGMMTPLTVLMTISQVIVMFFRVDNPFGAYVLLPILLVPHFYAMIAYWHIDEQYRDQQQQDSRDYIDTIFKFMEQIGTAMAERMDVEGVLDYILDSIVKTTNADAGAALLVDEYEDVLRVRSVRGFYPPPYEVPRVAITKTRGIERYFRDTPIPLGETLLGEAVANGEPVYIRTAATDERMSINRGEDALFVSSIIVLPLVSESRVLGVMSVVSTQLGVYFEEADFERCRVFAEYATLTLENLYTYMQALEKREIEQEVGIAADVQRKLVPSRVPTLSGSDLAAFTKPARGVSGDYYDIVKLNDAGKVAMVVCDVAGKGVPASLVMVMIRTILHLVASDNRDAAKMVTWINRGIAGEIDIERFATMSILVYDPQTRTLDYSNAAHHPAVLYKRETGTVERIDTEGLPIGLERGTAYGRQTVPLAPGDTVLLFTDGITEALNEKREQFGDERLLDAFKENATNKADDIVNAIRQQVTKFIGGAKQHDDQTVLVLQAK